MTNAIILNYASGTINILPIPETIPDDKQCEFVENHPAYSHDECSYMLVEGDKIGVYKVTGDHQTYELHEILHL